MAKDPAFLFYPSDFLTGVTDLTLEERGQYITLLCLQHQKGVLSEKTIRLSVGKPSVDVISKFMKDEDGNYYNDRLAIEIEKRANFVDSRRNNGAKGGRPKAKKPKPSGKPNGKPTDNLPINRDININKSLIELKLEEFYNFRIELKKPILDASKESFKKKLVKLANNDEQTAIEILEQSIANGWQGIFKLKQETNEFTNNKQISKYHN